MKIISTVLFALFLLSGISFAQVGVSIGANVDKFQGNSEYDLHYRTGIAVGIYYDYPGSGFGFMPEILYSQKGATFSSSTVVTGHLVTGDATMKYDYIELPLLGKYSFEALGNFRPFLLAGPYVGILINSKMSVLGTDQTLAQTALVESDISDQQKFDFGITFGGGVSYNLGKIGLNINFRYSIGMLNVDKASLKNSGFSIMLGMLL